LVLTGLERKHDALTELLHKLSKEGREGIPILVEGKKDLYALRRLGVKSKIVCVKASSKILIDKLDTIKEDEIIVLVDFDRDGKMLVSRMATYLESQGVKVNLGYWKEMSALVRRDVKDVEGLPSFLEKLKKHIREETFRH
jgi:5S rRNA maturation endonuclease (ribonuclease M5)